MSLQQLISLGGELGLHYPTLEKMTPLLAKMVAAWLQRQDNVMAASGDPSWSSLIRALRKINQGGVASEIENGKALRCEILILSICSILAHPMED